MSDAIHRFLFEALDIRGALVQLGPSWRALHAHRGYPPGARRVLGELAAITALIAGNLKTEQRIGCQLQGHGSLSLLLMDCQPVQDGPLHLRGMARGNWQDIDATDGATDDATDGDSNDRNEQTSAPHAVGAVSPRLCFDEQATLPAMVGDGRLVLTLYGDRGQSYQSLVPLTGNSMAAAFEHYLEQSEQQPAALWLAANADSACGLFLQCLPGAERRDADGWSRVRQLAATVTDAELGLPPQTLLGRLFAEEDVRLFAPRAVAWHCPRDEAKVREMLRSLGRAEIENLLAESGHIEIEDEICGQTYRFGREVIDQLFAPAGRTLH